MSNKKRTEDEIVTSADITVILGGKKYGIKPLVIKESRVWRKKLIELIAPLPGLVNTTVDTDNPEGFSSALTQIMVTMPDEVVDLFFEYARDLDRDETESIATDKEIADAFNEVIQIAFPLAQSPMGVMKHISR